MIRSGGRSSVPVDLGRASAVGSVLLVLVFLVKVYAVARYSLTTMTGLVVATPLQVALGTVSFYAYLVMPTLALGTTWLAVSWLRRPDRAEIAPATWPVLTGVAVLTALMSPVAFLWTGVALVAACLRLELEIRRVVREEVPVPGRRRSHRWLWWLLAVVAVAAACQAPDLRLAGLALVAGSFVVELPLHRAPWRQVGRWPGVREARRRLRDLAGAPGFGASGLRQLVVRVARQVQGRTFFHLGTLAVVWYLVATVDTPWVPAQILVLRTPVEVSTQDKVVFPRGMTVERVRAPIGYLLADDGDWAAVLDADTRRVLHVRSADIAARVTCHRDVEQLPGKPPLLYSLTHVPYTSPNLTCETLREELVPARGVALAPDGGLLAAAGWDGAVGLWNPTTGRPLGVLPGRTPGRRAAASPETGQVPLPIGFDPTGKLLAAADPDGSVTLFPTVRSPGVEPFRARPPLPAHPTLTGAPAAVTALAFAPDGRTLATAADDTVTLWDPASGQRRGAFTPAPGSLVNAVAFAGPDGRTLVTGGDDDRVRLWDVAEPAAATPLGNPLDGHVTRAIRGTPRTNAVYALAVSADGRTLAAAGGRRDIARKRYAEAYQADASIRLWDLADRRRPSLLADLRDGHTGAVDALAFSRNGILASGGSDASVRLWTRGAGPLSTWQGRELRGHTGAVNALAFGPDGETLASTGTDQLVRLWSAGAGRTWSILTPP